MDGKVKVVLGRKLITRCIPLLEPVDTMRPTTCWNFLLQQTKTIRTKTHRNTCYVPPLLFFCRHCGHIVRGHCFPNYDNRCCCWGGGSTFVLFLFVFVCCCFFRGVLNCACLLFVSFWGVFQYSLSHIKQSVSCSRYKSAFEYFIYLILFVSDITPKALKYLI